MFPLRAAGETRTHTGLRPPPPQSGASTIPPLPHIATIERFELTFPFRQLLWRMPSSPSNPNSKLFPKYCPKPLLDSSWRGYSNSPSYRSYFYLILLVISCLSDSILVKIPKGSPLVAVDEKSPLYPRATFKHKRPGSTLRNLKVMLVLGPGKPY